MGHGPTGEQIRHGKAMAAAHAGEWEAAYKRGETLQEIGRRYGVGGTTVARAIRRTGGAIRKRGVGARNNEGPENRLWKGGHFVTGQGYEMTWIPPDHRFASMRQSKCYVATHRLVMAEAINRPLERWETVHHINGDRLDNRPENLQLRSGRHGNGVHFKCLDCGSQNVAPARLG